MKKEVRLKCPEIHCDHMVSVQYIERFKDDEEIRQRAYKAAEGELKSHMQNHKLKSREELLKD